MSIIEFTSTILNKVVSDLNNFGYAVTAQQEGYDQRGNNVTTKVLVCERSHSQILIQVTKAPIVVENENSSQPEDTTVQDGIEAVGEKSEVGNGTST